MSPPRQTARQVVSKVATSAASKIGGLTRLGDRAEAVKPEPSESASNGSNKTQISTYFTKVPVPGEATAILYNGDRLWARVILTLETAGPVAVGQSSSITPVLSGKGALLETGVPTTFSIAAGTRLYIASTAVNRVKFVVESVPWLEQMTALLRAMVGRFTGK